MSRYWVPSPRQSSVLDSRVRNRCRLDAGIVFRREPLQEMLDAMFEWMECEAEDCAEYCARETIVHVQRMNEAMRDVDFDHGGQKEQ